MLPNRNTILFALVSLLISCSEIKTSDPDKVFMNWSGSAPPKDIQVLNGQYWQSSHPTKEYIMYLELKPTKIWWIEFVKQNELQIVNENWVKPNNAPIWFNPTSNFKIYKSKDKYDQGSRYFEDSLTGNCYIYEIQL